MGRTESVALKITLPESSRSVGTPRPKHLRQNSSAAASASASESRCLRTCRHAVLIDCAQSRRASATRPPTVPQKKLKSGPVLDEPAVRRYQQSATSSHPGGQKTFANDRCEGTADAAS